MLDTDFNSTAAGLTADGYLNAKLSQKAPFVQIIKQVRTEDNKAASMFVPQMEQREHTAFL
ncbi:MAG: hypothetical protein ACLTGK_00485 [Eubacterium sp.]